jgi:hypothetical protein
MAGSGRVSLPRPALLSNVKEVVDAPKLAPVIRVPLRLKRLTSSPEVLRPTPLVWKMPSGWVSLRRPDGCYATRSTPATRSQHSSSTAARLRPRAPAARRWRLQRRYTAWAALVISRCSDECSKQSCSFGR